MTDAPERIWLSYAATAREFDIPIARPEKCPGYPGILTEYIRADLAPTDAQVMARSAIDVLAERQRQIDKEGWDSDHDDKHPNGEIAGAAACYAMHGIIPELYPRLAEQVRLTVRDLWPWALDWWKPTTPRRDLVKAAALILAEIDRLDRAALRDMEDSNG